MRLPDSAWRHWPGMDALLEALDAEHGKVRFVGGAVRDSLLGIEVQDVDCATVFAPEEVMARLQAADIKVVPTGLKHGTVTAVIDDGRPIEVTTLRRDVATDGRHAEVEYSEDWEEDAARRDFTINALSADPLSGEIFDYFGGEGDLEARRVRFIGLPAERIAEDHLRILRFFRFHARFGAGLPNPAGLAAARKHANSLMALSRERIADELLKILALPDPGETVALMIENGIFSPVLPEIVSADGLTNVIGREQKFGQPGNPVRRLAALLPPEPDIATSVATRLKFSRAQRKRLATAAARMPGDTAEPRALGYRLGMESAVDRLLLCPTNDTVTGNALTHLIANPPPRFPLKGGELIAMGIEAGPEVAIKLREIEDAWIAEDFPDGARARQIAEKVAANRSS
jgi:poly(A) polymerase